MANKMEKQSEMFSLIESWKGSGQSQQKFCKASGLAYSGFHYWYKKYRQAHQPPSSDFITVSPGASSGSPIAELIMPDGKRINFYQPVDAAFLRALLS